MKMLSWITKETNIDFLKVRKLTYTLTLMLVALSCWCIAFKGFNYGIDFSGGVLIELKSDHQINPDTLRSELSGLNLDEVTLQTIGDTGDEIMLRVQGEGSDEDSQRVMVAKIRQALGNGYEYRRVETVGPQVGDELKRQGILASLVAILAISAYIWFRFEWQFALGALIGLFNDLLITAGLLSFFNFDFSLTTVAAILTVAGYSVNDKVVSYDRIRENLRKYKKMPQYDLLNKSINDIFSRTILTGLTTIFAAVALFIFGGDTLRSFSFTILFGVIIGTYSSIYVSDALLNLFDLRVTQEAQKNVNPFGNA